MSSMQMDALAYTLEEATKMECPPTFIDRVKQRVVNAPQHPDVPGTLYRASSIGKPWIVQVLDRWYGGARRYTVANCITMLNGSIMQELIAEILTLAQYNIEQEVTVSHNAVTGHADIVVTLQDTVIVLECKSMAPHVIAGFANNPSDDYGYMSQLSFYWKRVSEMYPDKKVEAAFALFDRGASKIRVVPIIESAMERKVHRIDVATEILGGIADYDVDKLLANVVIPPTVSGKIPTSMSISKWAKVLYKGIDTADGARYEVQDLDAIARQLKQLPLSRADYVVEA